MTVEFAKTHCYSAKDKILLDTNIWAMIEDQQLCQHDPGYATLLYTQIIKNRATIFASPVIIQELVNLLVRVAYSTYCEGNGLDKSDFQFKKDYCKTDNFKSVYKLITEEVSQEIIPNVELLPSRPDSLVNALNNPTFSDFNDNLVAQQARHYGLTILTDDFDFVRFAPDIPILSLNKKTLQAS